MGYEATKFEDNSFDVILGNIPFNSVKIYDRRYNEHANPYIHDYFFISPWTLRNRAASLPLSPAKELWIARTRAFGNISHGRVHRRHSPTQHSVQVFGGNRCDSGHVFLKKERSP